ncbi:MerR family DNA-binding transcriptional regulator [Actinoplanes sp. NPDC051859]|uniref:DNA polymerase III subunit beta family protein n=1 Tax=Actinoplanes sp. NPDC051859 TaxID=3363909 RepID=UPI00379A4CBC
MYGIGEVARASGLGISALRFYDQAGVLIPAEVDPATGYRRYSPDQIRAARLVAGLRRVGMPVADIGRAVAGLSGPAGAPGRPGVRELLDEHLRRLEHGLADARRELSRLHRLLDLEESTLTRITLPAADLAAALDAVRYAAGTNPDLPMINCVLFEAGTDGLTLVATDRYRLAVAEAAGTVTGPPIRVAVPLGFVDELRPLVSGTVTLDLELSLVAAGVGPGPKLTAVPLDVDFPDHRRLAGPGAPGSRKITVDVPALRASLGTAATVVREHDGISHPLVVLSVDPAGDVRLSDEQAWAADEAAHTAVNREYLLQALDASGSGQLVLELDGPISPLAISGAGGYSILMPVRR